MAIKWLNIAEAGLSQGRRSGSADARWRHLARSWRAGLALVALCLSVYLPGLRSIPAVDRDEARFAQASRQMFEAAAFPRTAPERFRADFHDGGWAVPKIQDRQRLNKPPLIYWVQVASAWVFTGGDPLRDAIWMYRVPSVLAAIATVLITWRLGCSMFDPRAAWLAGAILAVAPMVVWDAHQARADSVMIACTTGTMWGLWEAWKRRSGEEAKRRGGSATTPTPIVSLHSVSSSLFLSVSFWACLSAGIMAKGFVTPMVVGLAAVFLCWSTRSWRWLFALRPLLGVVMIAAPLAPWLYALAQHTGGLGPYAAIVWDEFFVRGVAGSKEGHFWPPGFHTVVLAVLFWPGSLMTLAGFVRAWRRARGTPSQKELTGDGRLAGLRRAMTRAWTGRPAETFLIAWIVPAWMVFELSPAKLPHYTMPMLPAVALLSARMVLSAASSRALVPVLNLSVWAALGVAAILTSAIAVNFNAEVRSFTGPVMWLATIGALALAALVAAIRAAHVGELIRAQVMSLVSIITLTAPALSLLAPTLAPGSGSPAAVALASRWAAEAGGPIAADRADPSLIFATRGDITFIAAELIPRWLHDHPDGALIVTGSSRPSATSDRRTLRPKHTRALVIGPRRPAEDAGR